MSAASPPDTDLDAAPAALPAPGELALPSGWSVERGLNARQIEAVRRMLLALASDPRAMLARLEEQLAQLRAMRTHPGAARERLALESRAIYAPLANRLGAGELKWQIEDFAFRYLQPDAYHHIARALKEKRSARERLIGELRSELEQHLASAALTATVAGRAKHLYSIHRKMQLKALPLERLFDVCALRIVVAGIRECYSALGVVHGLWSYVPGEFDDYIATPKPNGYRSIHTAVVAPDGRHIEVQIRTQQMHEQAENGSAPHWKYKDGSRAGGEYERKIEWARRLLAPDGLPDADADALERMRTELFADRIYTLTPKGDVIELPRGGTPLDFAYLVHTGIGHRCRGAKVNGRIVPLTQRLKNGEVVQIITAREGGPSRQWLLPGAGYLASARNRARVRAWFKKEDALAPGVSVAESAKPPRPRRVAATSVARAPQVLRRARMPVLIEGLDDLPVTLARCCAPERPQPITAYLTLTRGVTVHRSECAGLERMRAVKPGRVLKVTWSSQQVLAGRRVAS